MAPGKMMVKLILLLVLAFAVSTVQAVTIITTTQKLQAMADDLDGDYILGNDIDLTGFPWQRIGPFTATPYFVANNIMGHS